MDGASARSHGQFAPLELARIGNESSLRGLFDTLFEESDTGLAILGLDPCGAGLKILDGNKRLLAWLGMHRKSIPGTDFMTILTPEARREHIAALRRAAIGWRGGTFHLALNSDNGPLPCTLTLRPVREDGFRCRLLAIFHAKSDDLRQRLTMAERERNVAQQTRNCLLAHLSHDLRTPLNGILGFAEMLQQDDKSPASSRDYATHIALAGRELLRRVEDLLTTADIMPPVAPETKGDANPGQLIEMLRPAAMEEASRLGIVLEFDIMDSPPMLRARSGDLQRLLEATLDCSLRGTPKGGRIRCQVQRARDQSLVLSFEDSGPRVTEQAMSALYDSAFSDEDIYTCRSARSAAGLVTARFLAESNGGSLHLACTPDTELYGCYVRFPADRVAPW